MKFHKVKLSEPGTKKLKFKHYGSNFSPSSQCHRVFSLDACLMCLDRKQVPALAGCSEYFLLHCSSTCEIEECDDVASVVCVWLVLKYC